MPRRRLPDHARRHLLPPSVGFGLGGGGLSPLGVGRASAAPAFTPASIAGLALWLKADAITGPSDGDPVATWADASGGGNDATQATAAARPLYRAAAVNGLPAVEFSVAVEPDHLDAFNPRLGSSAWTALLVARTTGGASKRVLAGLNNNWLLGWWGGGEDQAWYDGNVRLTGSPAATTAWRLYAGKGDGSAGYLYSSGALVATGGGHAGPQGLRLGGGGTGGTGEESDCQVAEVLAYDSALSDADRGAVTGYLTAKYAL